MRRALLPLVCPLVLVAACFASVLFADGQFGYRDVAHFYYPLYLRVQQEWNAGRIPLWEPEENGGIPLIGNPTAAVLYPGKVIYAVLPYAWAARVYVVAHVLLAFAGMTVLARSWGISRVGSTLCAASYAFGAPVLFQYTNIIYLVGAAWMPLGFHAVDRWVREGRRGGLPELAGVLAMQTLGGDPQSAYLVLVCGAAYAVGLARVRAAGPPSVRGMARVTAGFVLGWSVIVLVVARQFRAIPSVASRLPAWIPPVSTLWTLGLVFGGVGILWTGRRRSDVSALRPMVLGLAIACTLAVALAAVQLIPTVEYSRQSFRALDRSPVEIYPFSVEPYRIVELVWPGIYGMPVPRNRYWLPTIEPSQSHEFWSPSLYIGGLTLVLALTAAGLKHGPAWRTWLTVVAVVSLLASLGRNGSPLWLARHVPALAAVLGPHDPPFTGPFRPDGQPLDGDGGVYWLMAIALPGFGTFRFPAKLWTLTALATSALAGQGWDSLVAGRSRKAFGWGLGLLAMGLAALAATFIWRDALVAGWARRGAFAASPLGPFEPRGALAELRRALAHGTVVLAVTASLASQGFRRPRLAGALALGCLTADLAIASGRIVWTIPQRELERTPDAVRLIEQAERANPSPGPFRIHRMPHWFPSGWPAQGPPGRLRGMVAWERDTLQPLYGLPEHASYTMTKGALELYDYLWFFRPRMLSVDRAMADALATMPGQLVLYYPRRGFDLWGTRYYILPVRAAGWTDENRAYAAFLEGVEMVYPKLEEFRGPEGKARMVRWRRRWEQQHDWQIFKSKTAYPRAWIVHDARFLKPVGGLDPSDRERPMRMLLYQNDSFWRDSALEVFDPRQAALVETDHREDLAGFLPGGPTGATESVNVVHHGPQRVELDATLVRAGLVVLADVYYPGWRLTIDGDHAPILRVNRMMRGAAVRSGRHRLVYVYEPASFRIGAIVSAAALVALAGLVFWASRSKAPARPDPAR